MPLAGRDHGGAFFHCSVVQRVDGEAVPVDEVGSLGGIGHIDGHGHTLAQAQQRAGHLAVVRRRLHGDARRDFKAARLNGQRVIGGGGGLLRG